MPSGTRSGGGRGMARRVKGETGRQSGEPDGHVNGEPDGQAAPALEVQAGRHPWDASIARTGAVAEGLAALEEVSPFPPIADYGFLSDCEVSALIAPSGNVEWMCVPRMDSPSIFGAILDRGAGGFRLGPAGVTVPASRRYLPGTMILETSWESEAGWAIVRDVLLIGQWHHKDELSRTY